MRTGAVPRALLLVGGVVASLFVAEGMARLAPFRFGLENFALAGEGNREG